MGRNGNNGKKIPSELIGWIDPELLNHKPTDRQKAFRRVARHCVLNSKLLKSDWYAATTTSESEAFKSHPVTPSEWRRWTVRKSFMVWFYEDFPEVEPLSEQELQMIEHKWWKGVLDAMDAGEEWAYRAFAKVRYESRQAEENRTHTKELKEYLGNTSEGEAWHINAPEA
ncbi:hypothetical protein CMI37_24030 [Candidatus Pacearchaeota archaeon]|nr:hypothetical protein [Candidatus Pacearchaeota archaeon]|tara:strand:+ start:2609 stop:3118 length:510 start_codon:yes stop_codon:yes gene_type:complete